MPTPPLPAATRAEIERLLAAGLSAREVAARTGRSLGTVSKVRRAAAPALPDPAPEAGGPALPPAWAKALDPVVLADPGWWLVLGDTHFPMHDRGTIEAAVREAKAKNAAGVLFNGDMMDMVGVTPFFREPSKEGFHDEIECGRQAFRWFRAQLPKARFVMREGNHEFRLRRFIVERAAALYDLPELRLPALIGLPAVGCEWVQDKRKVMLGKLATLHGHELRKGEGVNPARFAFLRTTSTVLVNHFHRSSEHHQRALDEKHFAAWSVGCACYTSPDYDPFNQWNHGYAMVEVAADGWFSVHNRRVLNGRVV
jgi:predicted phosphodiesterase